MCVSKSCRTPITAAFCVEIADGTNVAADLDWASALAPIKDREHGHACSKGPASEYHPHRIVGVPNTWSTNRAGSNAQEHAAFANRRADELREADGKRNRGHVHEHRIGAETGDEPVVHTTGLRAVRPAVREKDCRHRDHGWRRSGPASIPLDRASGAARAVSRDQRPPSRKTNPAANLVLVSTMSAKLPSQSNCARTARRRLT